MFVVVEDSAPHEVVVYQPGAATIDGARREYHSILQRIKWCEAHGIWPGLGYDYELEDYQVQPIDVPQWKLDEYEQEAAI
jgi:hypothetical protein